MLLLIENIFWSGIDIYKKVERYIYIIARGCYKIIINARN